MFCKDNKKSTNTIIKLNHRKLNGDANMVDKICDFLTNKIKEENTDIDDERAEIINYGLHLIIGEIPKIFIFIGIGFLLGVGKLTILAFLLLLPYRMMSGGFHLHTHLGCIIGTTLMYCGTALLSKYVIMAINLKIIFIIFLLMFGFAMITLYAPADTENVPILRKKERRQKRNLSYVVLLVSTIIAFIIKNVEISNILLYGSFIQTLTITRFAYKLTNNQYGYEIYLHELEKC